MHTTIFPSTFALPRSSSDRTEPANLPATSITTQQWRRTILIMRVGLGFLFRFSCHNKIVATSPHCFTGEVTSMAQQQLAFIICMCMDRRRQPERKTTKRLREEEEVVVVAAASGALDFPFEEEVAGDDVGDQEWRRPPGVFRFPWQKCRGGLGVAGGGLIYRRDQQKP
ncbi:hypothetical protein ABZP36_035944 [Zizania latifolia]